MSSQLGVVFGLLSVKGGLFTSFLIVCPFDYTAGAGEWEGWARKLVNHTSWVAVISPTDRPRSVRHRCVTVLFGGVVVLSLCPFDSSVGIRAFVIGLSQISSIFLFQLLHVTEFFGHEYSNVHEIPV